MAEWIDPEGKRYWIDGDPVPGIHRDDLVPAPPEEAPLIEG
jgi:hypothetical protein